MYMNFVVKYDVHFSWNNTTKTENSFRLNLDMSKIKSMKELAILVEDIVPSLGGEVTITDIIHIGGNE